MSLDLKERTECMFGFIMACALGDKNVSPQCLFSPGISTAIYVPTKKINYKFVVKSFLYQLISKKNDLKHNRDICGQKPYFTIT